MEKSVALFYFKKIWKSLQKPIDKHQKVCYNIGTEQEKGSKKKEWGIKMKILKNILNWFMLICGAKSELTDKAVSEKICDFSGQGRNEFGKWG